MGKNKKKKESYYDADQSGRKFGKWNFIMLAAIIIIEAVLYYVLTPTINLHSVEFWIWMIVTVVALFICTLNLKAEQMDDMPVSPKLTKIFGIVIGIMILAALVGWIGSSKLFAASKYAGLIRIEDGNFEKDIVESKEINDIALMDTDTAVIIGERAIGSLSDVVSQYEVSSDYSTIDYNGSPMKVAALEYAGFIKYMNNKKSGIPGYVLVDPVKNEAKYVKLEKPMIYSPSAYFNQNLYRHVQMAYPTAMFEGFYLELDDNGNPYYICPVLKPNAGLFGAKDVKGIVLCDPCSGDCEYMDLGNIPNWVDRVYDGDLLCDRYNWYGMLSGGFINSKIGNKGCKVTTDDYGYKVMDGDVWVYTGVTSVNGDQSNIGFVLMNSRTAESKYFAIAGAEEHSAMSSAEGQVQNLGYTSSFPSLINIGNVPTYIMVLKDNAGLVKMYALVNVEKYSIVATGATQKEALASYRKLLAENSITTSGNDVSEDTLSKKITVTQIRYITVENETYVYITAKDRSVYKQNFADNESLIKIEEGDVITVHYMEGDDGVNTLFSYE